MAPKTILFSAFQRVSGLLLGRGIGKIPGVHAVHDFLFRHLWSNKDIIEIQGSKMYVNPDNLPPGFKRTFQFYATFRSWERQTVSMFKKVVKEGDIVVDLGANIGYYTLLAARLVGRSGKVYAFEPEPVNYSLLLKNIEINGYDNVIPTQKAISDTTGTVRLFLDNEDTGAHTIYQPGDKREFIEVESVRLDNFFKGKECPINVIKMDIEGAEIAALSGMDKIIKQNRDLKMFAEFYLPAIGRSGSTPEEFAGRLLEDYQFSVLAMDYQRCVEVRTVDELMKFVKGQESVNLFLERG